MYVTRPLSLYRKSPEALSLPPPEGPSSGYLVLHDEESQNFCCFGICKDRQLYELPFPQNMDLTIQYTESSGDSSTTYLDPVMLIPVLGQPLSSNRYYAIQRRGKRKGQAHATSTDEDKGTCLCFRYVRDRKPAPLDPTNINQQFEIYARENACGFGGFSAKSVLPDGYPPVFLRRKGWRISAKTPRTYELEDAEGVDLSLRKRLPNFDFPADRKHSDVVVVGKWYCPFMFIKDGDVSEQIKSSRYYKMTLEQQWAQVLKVENEGENRREVVVDVGVQGEEVTVGQQGGRGVGLARPGYVADGVVWFEGEGGGSVGLSEGIVERMRWEEGRVGYEGSKEGVMRLRKEEEFTGDGEGWVRFGMYVLVERFVLVRMNGSFVMSYEFRHLHHSRSKWDSI
ncbi:hypothetical protein MLD38_017469 [Melastoma candidum]|uniref:Uncharacterized protein n=1 Tax=Melastoma candidum TaxID=119954 RepID=A0ACB9QS28_9MYRT|nr:hypothetical protein MLD38_017469 [Melastoma candidum]